MNTIAKVRIVKQDGEYICKAYDHAGKRIPVADYFTNDKLDAQQTAQKMVQHA